MSLLYFDRLLISVLKQKKKKNWKILLIFFPSYSLTVCFMILWEIYTIFIYLLSLDRCVFFTLLIYT